MNTSLQSSLTSSSITNHSFINPKQSKERSLMLCSKCKISIPLLNIFLRENSIYLLLECKSCNFVQKIKIEEYFTLMGKAKISTNNCNLKPNHSSIPSNLYCLNCRKWLCNTCFNYHQSFPSLTSHITLNKEIIFNFTCQIHHKKQLKVICNDCHTIICKKCLSEKHHMHSTAMLESVNREINKLNLEDILQMINNNIEKNHNHKDILINHLNTEIDELKRLKNEIELSYEMNKKQSKMIFELLTSLNDNYAQLEKVPCYELMINIKQFFNLKQQEPEIYSSDLKKNCLNLIYYFKTSFIIDLKKEAQCISSFHAHNDRIFSLIQLFDERIASGSWDKTIKVWNINKSKCEVTIHGHIDKIFALTQLKDTRLVSCSRDKTIKIWDIMTWKCVSTLIGHSNTIFTVIQLKNGNIGSASADKMIKIWDRASLNCINTAKGHTDAICSLIQLNDCRLASGSCDKTIKLWEDKQLTMITTLEGHEAEISILIQLNNGRLASGSKDKSIIIWDLIEFTQVEILKGHRSIVFSLLQLNNDILISGTNQDILLWNITSKKPIMTLTEHHSDIRGLVELKNGIVASCSDDKRINLWII